MNNIHTELPDEGQWQATMSEAVEVTEIAENTVRAQERGGSPDKDQNEHEERRDGEEGHNKCSYCDKGSTKKKRDGEDYRLDRCFYCHKEGHKRANCEQRTRDIEKGEKESKTCSRCAVIKSINQDDPITLTTSLALPTDLTSFLAEQHLLRLKSKEGGMGVIEAITVCLKYATRWGYSVEDVTEELLVEVENYGKEHSLTILDPSRVVEKTKERLRNCLKGEEYTPEIPDRWIGALARALGIRITLIIQDEDDSERAGLMSIYPTKRVDKKTEVYLIKHHKKDQGEFEGYGEQSRFDSVIPGRRLRKRLVQVSKSEGECLMECPLTNQKYLLFQHPSPLSNLAEHDLVVNNEHYSSMEQYYQASKFKEDSAVRQSIMHCSDQREIKRLGRKRVKGQMIDRRQALKQLDDRFEDVMSAGLAAKFDTEGSHQDHLLRTSECILVDSTHGNLWGIGRDFTRDNEPQLFLSRTNWIGTNWLGMKLMRIRSDLNRPPTSINHQKDATAVELTPFPLEGEPEEKEEDQKSPHSEGSLILSLPQ